MDPVTSPEVEPQGPRRVVTSPARVSLSDDRFPRPDSGSVATLYLHPDVRVVSFTADGDDPRDDDSAQSLSWSSPRERTIAVGLFRIYQAPGSVAFLSCGSALKPIMPKGQCWSITKTNSKFVLQIRRPHYWRIELPDSNEEDLDKARALRAVLGSILQFEKTPCPFRRSFTVTLPEQPCGPNRKKSWAPKPQRSSVDYSKIVDVAALPTKLLGKKPRNDAKLRRYGQHNWSSNLRANLEDAEDRSSQDSVDQPQTAYDVNPAEPTSTSEGYESIVENKHRINPELPSRASEQLHSVCKAEASPVPGNRTHSPPLFYPRQSFVNLEEPSVLDNQSMSNLKDHSEMSRTGSLSHRGAAGPSTTESPGDTIEGMGASLRRRHTGFGKLRSGPSAPQLTLVASPPSKSSHTSTVRETEADVGDMGRTSPTWSSDSYHSTQSWLSPITPLPPSPPGQRMHDSRQTFPYPHDHISLALNRDQNSEPLGTPETPHTVPQLVSNFGSVDRTPTQVLPQHHLSSADTTQSLWLSDHSADSDPLWKHTNTDASGTNFTDGPKQTAPSRLVLSPSPPAANVQHGSEANASTRISSRTGLGTLPIFLLSKTCGFLLRPPGYLMTLMLKVAARIAAGEWRGTAMGYDPTGNHIPVDWDYSDSEWDEAWEVDHSEREEAKSSGTDGRPSFEDHFEDANQSWEVD